jgi:eukaryotic-like serine/threonine-protein kinase
LPVWSPDSRFFVFSAGGKLKKIEVAGGPAQVLGDTAGLLGGFFTSDGRIVFTGFGPRGPVLLQINASGGVVTNAPVAPLPDGRHFLYTGASPSTLHGTYLGSLDGKPPKKLLPGASGIFAPSPDPNLGYVLFVRQATLTDTSGTLMAQPFDPRKRDFTGDPIPIAEKVSDIGFSASSTGVLAYRAGAVGPPGALLSWYDRTGKLLSTTGDPGVYQRMSFSPDGTRVVAERFNLQSNNGNLWIFDLKRDVSTQFTSDAGTGDYAFWSPDGREIAFLSTRGSKPGIYVKPSDGSAEEQLLYASDSPPVLGDWSSDGRFITYHVGPAPTRAFVLPVEGGKGTPLKAGKPYELVKSNGEIRGVRFSRDMHWIAYLSNETGRYEIYVRAFDPNAPNGTPTGAGTYKISTDGGTTPRWNENGKELFYRAGDGSIIL